MSKLDDVLQKPIPSLKYNVSVGTLRKIHSKGAGDCPLLASQQAGGVLFAGCIVGLTAAS